MNPARWGGHAEAGTEALDLAVAGLRQQLRTLEGPALAGLGLEPRCDELRAQIDDLLDQRLLVTFLAEVDDAWWVWPGEERPEWPTVGPAAAPA